jgi:Putative prokaryotic signal transducing protein
LKNNEKMVEVYDAPNNMEAQVIKGLLESFNIPCFLKSNAAPSVHTLTMDGMGEVKIMVLESLAEKARKLINKGEDKG